jgi:hypothetical protein
MSGKGEIVKYTRLHKKGSPLSQHDKNKLKADIGALIDGATAEITIDAMVPATVEELQEALDKKKKG